MRRLGGTGVLAALLMVAACGGTPPPDSSPTPASPSGSPAEPSPSPSTSVTPAAAMAVVRIEQSGGMLPIWETISWYPTAVLYADGRLFTLGPTIDIYPAPALPNLQVTQLTPEGVARVMQAALDSGLVGPDRDIGEQMMDAGTTDFTLTTAEGTHTTRLHGPTNDAAVVAVLRFQEALLAPREWFEGAVVGQDRQYVWDRLQVVSVPMSVDESPDPHAVTERDWPLDPLSSLGAVLEPGEPYRCAVVSGAELEALLPEVVASNELTLWLSETETYQLRLHPLLPDEAGCDGP